MKRLDLVLCGLLEKDAEEEQGRRRTVVRDGSTTRGGEGGRLGGGLRRTHDWAEDQRAPIGFIISF